MDNFDIKEVPNETVLEELGEIDFYTALQATQNELSTKNPDLFKGGDITESINNAQREKLQNYISKYVMSKRLKVKGLDTKKLCHMLYQEMAEFSILTDYIEDANNENEEINVNAWNDIEVRRSSGKIEKIPHFCNPDHARNVMRRLVTTAKKLIDNAMPMAEGNLRNNTRIVVLQSPLVDEDVGVACSIRLLKPQFANRQFFIDKGTVSEEEMCFLELAIRSGVSICFVGATGSGKTTLMNYLLSTIPDEQRIVTIENNARELSLVKKDEKGNIINNVVHTVTRPSEDEKLNIDQEDLVAKALRLDPRVICVGEMRDTESYAAQEASLTGHTVVTSLHADGVVATHMRIAMLCMKKYPVEIHIALLQAAMAFPVIVYLSKLEDNSRRVMEIAECVVEETERIYCTLFDYHIKSNKRMSGKVVIDGAHRQVGNISDNLRKIMMLNGATIEEFDSIKYRG